MVVFLLPARFIRKCRRLENPAERGAKAIAGQLWEETLDEFGFVDARGILQTLSQPA